MTRLSVGLKNLINISVSEGCRKHAPNIYTHLYQNIARDATAKGVGMSAWVSIAASTSFTLNSSTSLATLHKIAIGFYDNNDRNSSSSEIKTAALIREIGLRCIAFNGIPKSINMLSSFTATLSPAVQLDLASLQTASRNFSSDNCSEINLRGRALWTSIYHPHAQKLYDKLHQCHPDLPDWIIHCAYGGLLTNPEHSNTSDPQLIRVGRTLTSLIAIACLRAQSHVEPQLTSHIYGLRKAYERDTKTGEIEDESVKGGEWLASDEGNIWLLQTVDKIRDTLVAKQDDI